MSALCPIRDCYIVIVIIALVRRTANGSKFNLSATVWCVCEFMSSSSFVIRFFIALRVRHIVIFIWSLKWQKHYQSQQSHNNGITSATAITTARTSTVNAYFIFSILLAGINNCALIPTTPFSLSLSLQLSSLVPCSFMNRIKCTKAAYAQSTL